VRNICIEGHILSTAGDAPNIVDFVYSCDV
jgi:hypothetical protein